MGAQIKRFIESYMIKKAFTIIEMVVAISIILIILGLVLPGLSSLWDQMSIDNVDQRITNLIRIARDRSLDFDTSVYGLIFYIDPQTDKQIVAFIRSDSVPDQATGENYIDVCNRFKIDISSTNFIHELSNVARIASDDILKWTDEEILNSNYKIGEHRNYFVIIFQKGQTHFIHNNVIIRDDDINLDGFGDITNLEINNTVGDNGGVLNNIVAKNENERFLWRQNKNVLIYSEKIFQELAPDHLLDVPCIALYATPIGTTVRGDCL